MGTRGGADHGVLADALPTRWISSDPLFYWNGLALIGYTSWIGGLQDVVGEWLRRRQIDAALPEDETDANIPADAGVWLERALSQRLPREDIRGAIDAVVFASWMEDPNLPWRTCCGTTTRWDRTPDARHAGRRLELFVGSEPVLLWNGVSRSRASLEELFTAENVAWWARSEYSGPVGRPVRAGRVAAPAVVRCSHGGACRDAGGRPAA